MPRNIRDCVIGGLVVNLLGVFMGVAVAEAPRVPSGKLDDQQEARLRQLNGQVAEALGEGAFERAVEVEREIVALRERWQGEKHWQSVEARDELRRYRVLARLPEKARQDVARSFRAMYEGQALARQHEYVKAERCYQQVLELRRQALGEEHLETARAYNNLAGTLRDQGKYAAAQPLLDRALAICRKVLGEEHRETARTYGNLATILDDQGKYAEAQPLHEKALAIDRKVFGEDHLATVISCNNLALNLTEQGKYAEAQPLLERSLAWRRKSLGEQHPDTAVAYGNLAGNLADQGKYTEAQPLHEKALAIYRKARGEDHLDTATAYNNLAVHQRMQGKYAEALPLYEKALAIYRKALGEEHPRTGDAYYNLAFNLQAQGNYAQAQPLYQKALAIHRNALGEDHPATAASYDELGVNLTYQRKYIEAQPLLEKGLAIRRKVLGEQHPYTAISCENLAANLEHQGNFAQAQLLTEKALAITRAAFGEDHPATARSCYNLACSFFEQGKYDEARPLIEKGLARNRKLLGEAHPHTAVSYNLLAVLAWRQNKIDRAVGLVLDSLPGQEVARLHSAASGFDRAVATARTVSPQTLLALGLARLDRPADAFGHAEAGLARGLLDDLAFRATEDGRHAASLQAHLDQLDSQLLPLLGRTTLSDDQKTLRDKLVRQRQQTLARLSRLAADASARQVLPLPDIQKQLADDAALVFWVDEEILGEHHACIVRPRGEPVWARLSGSGKDGTWAAEDRELAPKFYRLLQKPWGPEAEREQLRKALAVQRLEPLRPHLGAANGLPAVRHLLVVPTGWAGWVPVEALEGGYGVSYVASGSVHARLRQKHRAVEGGPLLALGDPIFTTPAVHRPPPPPQGVLLASVLPDGNAASAGLRGGDVLLQLGDSPLASLNDLKKALANGGTLRYWREGREQSVKVPPGLLGVRVDERPAPQAVAARREAESSAILRGPDPVRLPGTRWEVQALSRLVPRNTVLLGSDASEQRLDELAHSGALKSFRLIHLATHGVVDLQTPARSRLLLARDHLPDPKETPPGRKPYSGELTVGDIRAGWQLDADLVVLSACQTALGLQGSSGEGLLGFTQAFLQCGARAVLLSRWAADDTATALLMLRFYENVLGGRKDLSQPLGRAAALAEAQRWLRELPRRDAEALAAALAADKLSGTARGQVVELNVKERPVRLPEGERPYAHPFFWAAFVLVGDPD
jgi:CHAT domain-containing protein/tetratricopeptide (TPR) repeat protein